MGERICAKSLGLLGICWLCCGVAVAKVVTYEDFLQDPKEQLLRNYFKQVKTLSCEYTVYGEDGSPSVDVELDWDIAGDRYYATRVYRDERSKSDADPMTWVNNGRTDWRAWPSIEPLVEGAWWVNVRPSDPNSPQRSVGLSDNQIPLIKKLLLRPQYLRDDWVELLQKEAETLKAFGLPFNLIEELDPNTHRVVRRYGVEDAAHGNASWREITADFSDGLRVYEILVRDRVGGKESIRFRATYDDFVKTNGIWLPRSIREEELDPLAGRTRVERVVFRRLQANVEFAPDHFTYKPKYGTIVADASGTIYRVGFADPFDLSTRLTNAPEVQATVVSEGGSPEGGGLFLPKLDHVDAHQVPAVLSLSGGNMLTVPESSDSNDISSLNEALARTGDGDVIWDGRIVLLRGAQVIPDVNASVPVLRPLPDGPGDVHVYQLPETLVLPYRFLVQKEADATEPAPTYWLTILDARVDGLLVKVERGDAGSGGSTTGT